MYTLLLSAPKAPNYSHVSHTSLPSRMSSQTQSLGQLHLKKAGKNQRSCTNFVINKLTGRMSNQHRQIKFLNIMWNAHKATKSIKLMCFSVSWWLAFSIIYFFSNTSLCRYQDLMSNIWRKKGKNNFNSLFLQSGVNSLFVLKGDVINKI